MKKIQEKNRVLTYMLGAYGIVNDDAEKMKKGRLVGMCSETPISSETEFIERVKTREMRVFTLELEE